MWLIYTLLATGAASARSLLSKKVVTSVSEWTALFTFVTFALPIALIYAVIHGLTINHYLFWPVIAIRVVIDTIATYYYFKALKLEEVSYIAPLYTLQPLFTTAISFVINHETPSLRALIGILIIIIGTSLSFISKLSLHQHAPTSTIINATKYALISMLFWSFASAIHKQGINFSSPATYFLVSYICFSLLFGLIAYFTDKASLKRAFNRRYRGANLGNGLSLGFDHAFTLTAITQGFVGYVDAIKSSNTMLTSFLAIPLFKEKLTPLKTTSILLVSLGILLIAINF